MGGPGLGQRESMGVPKQESPPLDESEVLLEFHRLGNAVKVTAVDPRTLAEATIVGDPSLSEQALGRAAIRKLQYVIKRRAEAQGKARRDDGRGGTLV